jgi:hypothetical protein
MSENIPALIAEANLHNWGEDREDYELPSRMIHALESLSASPGDDEREALDFDTAHDLARYAYEGRNNYGLRRAENGGIRMDEAHHSKGWEEGFRDGWDSVRRLSPLTQEALARALYDEYRARIPGTLTWENDSKADEFRASAARLLPLLSRFSLPEPAEDEWEYQCQLSGNPWTDVDADHRCPGIRRRRRKAGPWLPVEEGAKG